MFSDTGMDRCVDELSSTLELAEALEEQLEQVRNTVLEEQREGGEAAAAV